MAQKGKSGKPATNGAPPSVGAEAERLPASFLSLTLENVRCFGPKQTLDLSDGKGKPAPWTIILGLNGTGKTTLLQALVGFEHLPQYPNVESEDNAPHARFYELPIWTFTRDGHKDAEITIGIALTPRLSNSPSQGGEWSFSVTPAPGWEEAAGSIYGSDTGWTPPWCCAYGAGRRVGSASLSEPKSDDAVATLFSDKAELRNPEEWLIRLDYAAMKVRKDKGAEQRFVQVKELLLNILPDIADIQLATTGGPNPRPRADFLTPYGWVPLRQLGYGFQTLITWVADLANRMAERYPDSPNPLAEPAVVLVDEIDLHLHPKWQRKLMSFLTERFPNTQFIATAHSPLVAQAAADANLAVLRREGDHVVIDNDVDNIRNWRVDQILTSDLFGLATARPPQIEALLVERGTLLEKRKLTAADKRRLDELEALVGELPFGETAQERKERAAIMQALDALTKERKPAP